MELFASPAFRRKHAKDEEIELLEKWLRKSGIRWGQTSAHRDEILKEQHCLAGMADKSSLGTWEQGLEELLTRLIIDGEEQTSISATQAEVLGKFLQLLSSLRQDLAVLER